MQYSIFCGCNLQRLIQEMHSLDFLIYNVVIQGHSKYRLKSQSTKLLTSLSL
jgi:hypothetical protein